MAFRRSIFCAFLMLVVGLGTAAAAPQAPDKSGEHGGGILALLPPTAATEHSITIAGHTLAYEADAGTIPLLSGDGSLMARMFYVAYHLKQKNAPPTARPRPITFVFNGGPGAASAYLQIGALGPRILKTAPDGAFLPPPQALEDNPDTWLGMTDLVFVDPVGTGYSRAAPGHKPSEFWGVDQDASAMAAFIRLYLAEAGRTDSPVYLVGESYGGFRAALLAKTLQEDIGISPSGIVLVSPALEFSFVYGEEFKPLHWALELPSMAAVNLEKHGVSGDAFMGGVADAEHYAMTDYLLALTSGLEAGGKMASAAVARFTGLPLDLVQRHHARIPLSVFAKNYDRGNGRILSLYDGTIETADIAPGSDRNQTPDPVLERSIPVVTSAFVHYVRSELHYRTKISYRLLNKEIAGKWDYGT
ncbi:MAG TPA: peptidase S10, partial [Pararhizobium sp.]|nr:peptidase S10 [Pararhizobium sp.]